MSRALAKMRSSSGLGCGGAVGHGRGRDLGGAKSAAPISAPAAGADPVDGVAEHGAAGGAQQRAPDQRVDAAGRSGFACVGPGLEATRARSQRGPVVASARIAPPVLRALLELPFEHVLVSHGVPVHGRDDFVAALDREPWGAYTGA